MSNSHAPAARRVATRRQRGTTFAELMLATLIVSTTVVASTSSLSESAQVYRFYADGPHEALMLAQEIHEAAKLMPWKADAGALPVFGSDVASIWDLDGAEFAPPRAADYDVIVSHMYWKQEVEVQTVDLANPTVVIEDPETFEGDLLTQLVVTVSDGELELGTYKWWLSEPESND